MYVNKFLFDDTYISSPVPSVSSIPVPYQSDDDVSVSTTDDVTIELSGKSLPSCDQDENTS